MRTDGNVKISQIVWFSFKIVKFEGTRSNKVKKWLFKLEDSSNCAN